MASSTQNGLFPPSRCPISTRSLMLMKVIPVRATGLRWAAGSRICKARMRSANVQLASPIWGARGTIRREALAAIIRSRVIRAKLIGEETNWGVHSGLEKTMTVQITLKSTQHIGMATSTEGSVAAWQVTFELDEDESLHGQPLILRVK
jgi:hypothetical protein